MISALPECPITGLPAKRLIQRVSARLIRELWRHAFGISADRQLAGLARFGLWESPCGLAFFNPMLQGDENFYRDLYQGGKFHTLSCARSQPRRIQAGCRDWSGRGRKFSMSAAARAGWRNTCRTPPTSGSIPIFPRQIAKFDVRNETAAVHSASHPLEYDAVCAFHVIEHVSDPLGFARDLVKCVKPGGRLFIAVPGWPSPITDIPNFVFNAPPHHLSWWNRGR